MATYKSSDGTEKDTKDMVTPYLKNALKKAEEKGDKDNIDAITEELKKRNEL